MSDKVVALPVVRVERNEEIPEPFGWVAFYCGAELFMRSKGAAEFYAELCEVIPVYAGLTLSFPSSIREGK